MLRVALELGKFPHEVAEEMPIRDLYELLAFFKIRDEYEKRRREQKQRSIPMRRAMRRRRN
ncbi:MAG: hypothetical protein AB1896_18390 [Thermodesulfobacteriota bacterium]